MPSVFPTHAEEWEHNRDKLLQLNRDYPITKINAVTKGRHAQKSSADASGGLVRTLYLCKNARVSLTSNLNLKYSLFNRAIGTFVDIVYANGKSPANGGFPDFVLVDFPNYTGPAYMGSTTTS